MDGNEGSMRGHGWETGEMQRGSELTLSRYPTYTLGALTLLQQEQFRKDIANPVLAQEVLMDMVRRYAPPTDPNTEAATTGDGGTGAGENGEMKQEGQVNGNGKGVNGVA